MEPSKKKINLEIKEQWSNHGTFDISRQTAIGKIKSITRNMDISFELKIENMDSCKVDDLHVVLLISSTSKNLGWFWFGIKKSSEKSKFYIYHSQSNGLAEQLGTYRYSRQFNPLSYTNNWQKDFLAKISTTIIFNANMVFSILF